ncbi:hypothetical protein PENSPDRAFT_695344, partial [Peniophora sp. CONT]
MVFVFGGLDPTWQCFPVPPPLLVYLPPLLKYVAHLLYVAYPAPSTAHLFLALELIVLIILAISFWQYRDNRQTTTLVEYNTVATRAQRRHPINNLFIVGLSPRTIVLHVPAGATTLWIIHELERRHLVPAYRRDARLAYDLLVSPGGGAPLRPLRSFQDLAQAGVVNNSTLHARFLLWGGSGNAEAGPSILKRTYVYCGGCGRRHIDQRALNNHYTTSPNTGCKPPDTTKLTRLAIQERLAHEMARAATLPPVSTEDDDAMDVDEGDALMELDTRPVDPPPTEPQPTEPQPTEPQPDEPQSDEPQSDDPYDPELDDPELIPRRVERSDADWPEELERAEGEEEEEEEEEEREDPFGWGEEDEARARAVKEDEDEGDELLEEEEEDDDEYELIVEA